MIIDYLLKILKCPTCGHDFVFKSVATPVYGRGEFGVLNCSCSEYPVIDGIPIIGKKPINVFDHTAFYREAEGPTPSELVQLILSGKANEALILCLAPALKPKLPKFFGARLSNSWKVAKQWGRLKTTALLRKRDKISARDIFDFYFNPAALGTDLGDYFIYRFSQPRHLAALALVSNFNQSERPILDIACGAGHLDHYLTHQYSKTGVVGLDMCYFQIWIAQHWVAPLANYVCCDVSDGLPFYDDSFSSVVVSDAYHYFSEQKLLNKELIRVAPGKPVVITRVGNKQIMPNEGNELSLSEYMTDFEWGNPKVFSEGDLLHDYINNRNPLHQAQSESFRDLSRFKWLSFVCNIPAVADDRIFSNEINAPHAQGKIGVNPIYFCESGDGVVTLKFKFPGKWFAYENHQILEYLPRNVTLSSEEKNLLESGGWNDCLEVLLKQFVLIGLPVRYY